VFGGKILLVYSHSSTRQGEAKPETGIQGSFDIKSVEFDGTTVSRAADVSATPDREGNPSLVTFAGKTYAFYDVGPTDKSSYKSDFKSTVVYKEYLSGDWEAVEKYPFSSVPSTDPSYQQLSKAIQPAPVEFGGKLVLFFTKSDVGNWDILSSSAETLSQKAGGELRFLVTEIRIATDKQTYALGDTVAIVGTVEGGPGSPQGDSLQLTIGQEIFPGQHFDFKTEDVKIGANGEFSYDYQVPDKEFGLGSYRAKASYGGRSVEVIFKVS
jgi:hypothetical protein